jgi:hypothetical protein
MHAKVRLSSGDGEGRRRDRYAWSLFCGSEGTCIVYVFPLCICEFCVDVGACVSITNVWFSAAFTDSPLIEYSSCLFVCLRFDRSIVIRLALAETFCLNCGQSRQRVVC